MPALVLAAHGTRNPAGAAVTEALAGRVRALRPDLDVRAGYLGLVAPSLGDVLAGLRGEAVLVPLLLGTGHHVRVDIPAAAASAGPRLLCRTAPALGPHPLLAEALADRLAEAGREPGSPAPVVLAAAGSSDPAARADTTRMARLLALRLGVRVEPSYVSGRGPRPGEAVAALREEGHAEVSVATYLTGPGHFSESVRASVRASVREPVHEPMHASVSASVRRRVRDISVSAPLGPHEAVARLVVRRYQQAATGGCGHPGISRTPVTSDGRIRTA
ncbi:sirohydrochlorin chelatase [Streptomyces sp. NRRL B-1677]|uniref:sirohydrochlorin chelatase n=1 Tax=Streptomyces sp. NRRL B-1677 TaxID=2682966 RepID=UPI001892C6EC|nr:sirohydrochlorin chelatase [Streptomyces sp. NRRL B-1677]MBF6046326.1 sirohydrochlorin chelatase [Streptomyces sp. NRRL B-1677]